MITIIAFITLLGILVFVHELGHFLAAKSVGLKVEKFYLGWNLFGLGISRKWGETEYGIGLFPLGGYVKVAGIIDESMDSETKGLDYEYMNKSPIQQIWFASAGVIMNLLLAFFIFIGITFYTGIGEINPLSIVGEVIPEYPAEKYGIAEGDEIISIDGIGVQTWEEMTNEVHLRPNQLIQVQWLRNGINYSDSIQTTMSQKLVDGQLEEFGMIGITPVVTIHPASFGEAISTGFQRTYYWLTLTISSLKMIFSGDASFSEVGGPILIAKMAGESAKSGLLNYFSLLAIISINLALLNILPIPGLDGGHIIVSITEGIIRRKLPIKIKMGIQQMGLFFLMMIFFIVIYNDISRLFR